MCVCVCVCVYACVPYRLCYHDIQGRDNVLRVAAKMVMVEQECGLTSSVEDYQAEFKFGLAEVVYQWALGTVRECLQFYHCGHFLALGIC